MNLINKYIAIYILENKSDLEKLLDNIDYVKSKIKYSWVTDINKDDIFEVYYNYINMDVKELDVMLHFTHIKDPLLRYKTYIFVGYFNNKRIIFNCGITVDIDDIYTKDDVFRKLDSLDISLENIQIHKVQDSRKGLTLASIYISYLDIEEEINHKNMLKLQSAFKDGFVEKKLSMKLSKIRRVFKRRIRLEEY